MWGTGKNIIFEEFAFFPHKKKKFYFVYAEMDKSQQKYHFTVDTAK